MARITKKAMNAATRAERAALREVTTRDAKGNTKVKDSFQNFALNLGIGTDNPLTGSTYGFNPITRNRTLLEWIHRGSWLGGVAVDLIAEDMTRSGVDILCDEDPEVIDSIQRAMVSTGVWTGLMDTIKWARLYGGCLGVMMIDGQDYATPLDVNRVSRGQFKGIYPLDRWMVDPSLNDLVSDDGPDKGLPKFYQSANDVPGLRFRKIHHSRVVRLIGIKLPYWQALTENLWGISVLERLYDRMVAFDSATTGAAQMVYKAYVRTYKVKGLREILAAGGHAQGVLQTQVEIMRRFQSIEGVTMIDSNDEYSADAGMSMTGVSEALLQFGQQLSGALQIPLVRLFGQSPAGLNATGESDLRTYYDGINQAQNKDLLVPMDKIVRMVALSEGHALPDDAAVQFRPLWQLSETEKSEVAERDARSIRETEESGLITQKTALKELRASSKVTGRFTNITDEDIETANDDLAPRGEEAIKQEQELFAQKGEDDTVEERADVRSAEDEPQSTADARAPTGVSNVSILHCSDNGKPAGPPLCGNKNYYASAPKAEFVAQASRNRAPGEMYSCKRCAAKLGIRVSDAKDAMPLSEFAGLPVAIECPRGLKRWNGGPAYDSDYGYIRRVSSAEGPHEWMDCFIAPERDASAPAYVIDGFKKDGTFDEHKIMLGFTETAAAWKQWDDAYAEHLTRGTSTRMTIDELKAWLATADVTKPAGVK